MNNIKIINHGYAGHFICAERCLFRRNTTVEDISQNKAITVSTVGDFRMKGDFEGEPQTVGLDRYYETMMFEAYKGDEFHGHRYWYADVTKDLTGYLDEWAISEPYKDYLADEMHKNAIKRARGLLLNNLI